MGGRTTKFQLQPSSGSPIRPNEIGILALEYFTEYFEPYIKQIKSPININRPEDHGLLAIEYFPVKIKNKVLMEGEKNKIKEVPTMVHRSGSPSFIYMT